MKNNLRGADLTDDHYRQKLKSLTVESATGCWRFQGTHGSNGYGQINYHNKQWRVHRLGYFLFKGMIPEGHDVCHTCDVRDCCNPEHLWTGPRLLNNRDTADKVRNKNQPRPAWRRNTYDLR